MKKKFIEAELKIVKVEDIITTSGAGTQQDEFNDDNP